MSRTEAEAREHRDAAMLIMERHEWSPLSDALAKDHVHELLRLFPDALDAAYARGVEAAAKVLDKAGADDAADEVRALLGASTGKGESK